MSEVNFEPLSDYGDLMTLQEFNQYLTVGAINEEDGSGVFCTDTKMSHVDAFSNPPEWATHVMWFNK